MNGEHLLAVHVRIVRWQVENKTGIRFGAGQMDDQRSWAGGQRAAVSMDGAHLRANGAQIERCRLESGEWLRIRGLAGAHPRDTGGGRRHYWPDCPGRRDAGDQLPLLARRIAIRVTSAPVRCAHWGMTERWILPVR